VLTGCFILAFGWFGFNPGSTLGAFRKGGLRIGSVATNTMLAGMAGSFGAMLICGFGYGKPDASMSGNGLLAGSCDNKRLCFVIRWLRVSLEYSRVLVCISVEFVDRVLKVDDPVGCHFRSRCERPLGRNLHWALCRWQEQPMAVRGTVSTVRSLAFFTVTTAASLLPS